MDDPTRPRPAQASPSFDVDAYLASPRPSTGAFDVDAHLAATPYAKVAPLMFGTAPDVGSASLLARPTGPSGQPLPDIHAATERQRLQAIADRTVQNAVDPFGTARFTSGVVSGLGTQIATLPSRVLHGTATLGAATDVLAGRALGQPAAAQSIQQAAQAGRYTAPFDRVTGGVGAAIQRVAPVAGTPGKVGQFIGSQVPGVVAFEAALPAAEAGMPALGRIAQMGTAGGVAGLTTQPENPAAGLEGVGMGAGGELALHGLLGRFGRPPVTPVEAPVAPEAGAAPFVERRVGAPMPDVPVPLRRRVADAIDPEGAALRDTNPVTGLPGANPWQAVRPVADAHPDVEIVSADARNLKAINKQVSAAAGDQLIQAQANAYRQAVVEAGLDPRRVLFTPKGDELYAVVPQGMGQQIGARASELMGEAPVGGLRTGTRFGVGPTTAEADAAMNTAYAAEKAPTAPAAAPAVASTPSAADATPEAAPSPATAQTPPLPASDALTAADAPTGQPAAAAPPTIQPATIRGRQRWVGGNPKYAGMPDEALAERYRTVWDRIHASNRVLADPTELHQWSRLKMGAHGDEFAVTGTAWTNAAGRAKGALDRDLRLVQEMDAELAGRGYETWLGDVRDPRTGTALGRGESYEEDLPNAPLRPGAGLFGLDEAGAVGGRPSRGLSLQDQADAQGIRVRAQGINEPPRPLPSDPNVNARLIPDADLIAHERLARQVAPTHPAVAADLPALQSEMQERGLTQDHSPPTLRDTPPTVVATARIGTQIPVQRGPLAGMWERTADSPGNSAAPTWREVGGNRVASDADLANARATLGQSGKGALPLLAGTAAGIGGAAAGYATGKTPEERATRAAAFGLGGVALGVGAGRAVEGIGGESVLAPEGLTPDPRRAATGFAKVADDFRRIFAPTTRTPEAATTGLVMRQRLGEMKQANAQTMQALHDFRTSFAAAPDADRLAFIDRMERGAPQPTPALTQAATALRTALDQTRDQIRALGTGKLDQFIANYFPHIWENPDGAQSVVGRMLGQRPLEGSKSFLKERSIPTTAEGIAAGLKPVTTNPVDLTMLKLREMRKYLMAQQVLGDLKGRGLLKFVRSSESAPEGWTMLNDRVSTVTGPRDLSPAGPVIVGHQYAPGPVAEVVNNYLAPGLGGNALYDSYRLVGNTLNQAQLGLSAFHLGFTSLDAAISKAALGVMQGSRGDVGAAFKSAFGFPFAPVTTLLKGDKVLREYLTPGSQPAFADVVRSVTDAGGVAHLDDFYRTGMYDRFRDDWQQHTGQMVARTLTGAAVGGGTAAAYGALTAPAGTDASTRAARFGAAGAALGAGLGSRALGAVLDLAAKPVMEYVVPRQKLGVFADLSREMIGRLGPNASPDAVRAAAAEAWNSVDNRMGQLVYDNLFWHRAAKDLAMASVRSVGWNLGDFRELGGGVTDLAQTARQVGAGTYHGLSPRTAYTIALPLTVGLAGGVMTYLATGERPRSLLDYYYPRTGRQNPDGTEERVQLPSYMRDVYAYAHHPWTTLQHKLNPLAEGVAEMLNNRDFYGNMVRNPDDPALTQLGQVAAFAGDQFTPFGVRNAQDARRRGQSDATTAANFVGVTPAPRAVVRSDAENRMQELLSRRGIIVNTPEQVAARNARFQLERTLHTDPVAGRQALAQAVQAGTLTPQQRHQMLQRNFQDPTKLRFQQLTLPEALDVYQRATPEERATWWPALLAKRVSAQSRGDRAALRAYQAARPMDLPRGHLAGPPAAGAPVALATPAAGVTP